MMYQYEQSWCHNEDKQLCHHGINGQKWGKRNGPPYPLDYDQHSSSEKKKNTKADLNKYEDNNPKQSLKKKKYDLLYDGLKKHNPNMSKDEIDKALKNYNKAAKAVLIAGGAITLIAGGVYTYTYVKENAYNSDFVIRSGQELYRTAKSGGTNINDIIYVTPDKGDAAVYKYEWGSYYDENFDKQYKFEKVIKSNEKLKIAGKDTGLKYFGQFKFDNPELYKSMMDSLDAIGEPKTYRSFMRYAPLIRIDNNGDNEITSNLTNAFKEYTNILKENGYSGIIDYNDKYSIGLGTKAPTILFDNAGKLSVEKVSQLDFRKIEEAGIEAIQNKMHDTAIHNLSDTAYNIGAAAISLTTATAPILALMGSSYEDLDNTKKQSEK